MRFDNTVGCILQEAGLTKIKEKLEFWPAGETAIAIRIGKILGLAPRECAVIAVNSIRFRKQETGEISKDFYVNLPLEMLDKLIEYNRLRDSEPGQATAPVEPHANDKENSKSHSQATGNPASSSNKNPSDSPAVDEKAKGFERPSEEPIWLIILVIFVLWKANQTNFEYALSYCAANYFTGFLIAGIVWLFGARKGRTWTLGAWLNYAAYGMVGLLILAFIVRISVENSVQSTGQQGSNIGVQRPSIPNLPQPPSQSSPLHPEPIDQNNQFGSTPGPSILTEGQLTRMQRLLVKLGYRPGPIDGHAGPRTREAIRTFEKSHSWPETGEPSERLLSYLESRAAMLAVGNPDLEKPDCVLKRVMTDDDYRACGLKPPPSH